MNGKIGLRALSVLLAALLVSVAMVPAVAAQSIEKTPSIGQIEQIRVSDNEREHIVYSDDAKSKEKYLIREKKANVDQKDAWQVEIFEIYPDGTVSTDSLIKDSYYWSDDQGVHIHFGPIDMGWILAEGVAASGAVGGLLAVALNLSGAVCYVLAFALISLFLVCVYFYSNPDNSLDVFFSYLTIGLIPVYIAMPGPQPIVVRLGASDVVFTL
ncbi:MAG TPA: hypothetical protein PKH75_13905 [Bacillota bacterium]|nr:hypothetical protein [Bacillota bacterium]